MILFLLACNPPVPAKTDTDVPAAATAIVTTTDFAVGSLAAVDLEDWTVTDELAPTSGDPFVFVDDGHVLQVNGFQSDSVRVYEPGAWQEPLVEFSLGAGAGPHDVAVVGDELFVSLYEQAAMTVRSLADGTEVATVDLSAWADADGIPEASSIVEVDGALFVALQHFDRSAFASTGAGKVVRVDPATRQVTKAWDTGPSPVLYAHPSEPGTLVVATGTYEGAAPYPPALDGSLAVLDPVRDTLAAPLLADADSGYKVNGYGEVESGHAVLVVQGTDGATRVACWDGGALSVAETLPGWAADLAVDPAGDAWIAARDPGGLLVYDVETCTSRTGAEWIGTSLPPYRVAFTE